MPFLRNDSMLVAAQLVVSSMSHTQTPIRKTSSSCSGTALLLNNAMAIMKDGEFTLDKQRQQQQQQQQ
jgi:hypothetical protein